MKTLSGVCGVIMILLLLVSLGSVVSPRSLPRFLITLSIAVIFGLLSVLTHRLSRSRSEDASHRDSRFVESFIGVIVGFGISEPARQLIQYDEAPWWRVLILSISALVGGGVVTYSYMKHSKSARLNGPHRYEPRSE